MDVLLTDIPQKTALGKQEIREKKMALSTQRRHLLIMIDGRHSVRELLHFGRKVGEKSDVEALAALGLIALRSAGGEPAPQQADLQSSVAEALKGIYGEGIIKEIEKIAKKFPPETHAIEFLQTCREKAMMLLSKEQVDEMFIPLYKMIGE